MQISCFRWDSRLRPLLLQQPQRLQIAGLAAAAQRTPENSAANVAQSVLRDGFAAAVR